MLRPGRFRLNLSTGSTNSPVQRVKHRNENMMVSHRAIWGGGGGGGGGGGATRFFPMPILGIPRGDRKKLKRILLYQQWSVVIP